MTTTARALILRTALVLSLMLGGARPAHATDQVVSDPGDSGGANQLRAKLAAALSSGGGKITFNTGPATIVLANGILPTITANTTIDGGNLIGLSGANAFPVFFVNSSVTLSLSNLTVTRAYNANGDGGAIYNNGTLNINHCQFFANQAGAPYSGGAIVSYGPLNITNSEFGTNTAGNGGALFPRFAAAVTTISGCSFHDNTAVNSVNGWGGAILLWDGAPVTLVKDVFQHNSARSYGGGAYAQGPSSLTVAQCQFYSNWVQSAGGAIYSQGGLAVTGSAFATNSAYSGGAIYVDGGTAAIGRTLFTRNWCLFNGGTGGAYGQNSGASSFSDSIFSGNGYDPANLRESFQGGAIGIYGGTAALNRVTLNGNGAGVGGGLYNNGQATLQNVTISGNSADYGGGIAQFSGSLALTNVTICQNSPGLKYYAGTITAKNTLFAANTTYNSDVLLTGAAFCLSDDGTCGFGAGRDNVPNILLGPLALNGGFTPTHLPQPGSAAIDGATSAGAPLLDQRGYMRAGAAPDVGAAEYAGQPMTITSITRPDSSHVLLKGEALPNVTLSVLASPDLDPYDFSEIGSASTDLSGLWQYTNTLSLAQTNRFYRSAFAY